MDADALLVVVVDHDEREVGWRIQCLYSVCHDSYRRVLTIHFWDGTDMTVEV
jgi:hypothetical protein